MSHNNTHGDGHDHKDENVGFQYSGDDHNIVSDKLSEDQNDIKRKDFGLEKGRRVVDAVRPAPETDIPATIAMPMSNSNVRRSTVMRVEIHDTGTGLRNSDLMR
jgi:hypothetical protein